MSGDGLGVERKNFDEGFELEPGIVKPCDHGPEGRIRDLIGDFFEEFETVVDLDDFAPLPVDHAIERERGIALIGGQNELP